MTDWKDATNLMKVNNKKSKAKKSKNLQIGLRCWECGQYLDNLKKGHYCTNCLIKHLKKLGFNPIEEKETDKRKQSSEKEDDKKNNGNSNN